MLIHSVTPPHLLLPQSEQPASTHRRVGDAILEGMDTPEGFRMSRLCSTDPAMYLRSEFSPGAVYRGETN